MICPLMSVCMCGSPDACNQTFVARLNIYDEFWMNLLNLCWLLELEWRGTLGDGGCEKKFISE